ncbi:MAG: GGDEF and EAL domain-containing protein [Xanthomonadaceae bacterium]|nr:GGDEF and EAL domain-containing protein [Xanthomonadaceae bacterium]MDP2186475.1 GGDEF and EAL domain-containing protein [Xanthomonadales bacterium]MDZ4117395.1 GGDEF and EAL domain-containing protein [Xanthomonadaceae bacterium]MDZ4379599.1 GGDEF and EAL domain-containing protein [Xanthomonadaceae bacterium]
MNQCLAPAAERVLDDDDIQTIATILNAPNLLAVTGSLKAYVARTMDAHDVVITWRLPHGTEHSAPSPVEPVDDDLLAQAEALPGHLVRSADRAGFALCIADGDLAAQGLGAYVVAGIDPDIDDKTIESAFPAWLRSCVSSALDKSNLRALVSRLDQSERLQHALFAIADMASSGMDMGEMLRRMHQIIAGLMYAENIYIALYDKAADEIRFLLFVDTQDVALENVSGVITDADQARIPMQRIEGGITWHLIHGGKALMGSTPQIASQVSGKLTALGSDCHDLLGVPMIAGNSVRGVIVVQSYSERPRYTEADKNLLAFVSSHVLTALDRKQAHQELERRVAERTQALTQEIHERERSERLQGTLFRIAELSSTAASTDDFYGDVHRIIGEWIDCRNFYIALISNDGEYLQFAYFVDEHEATPAPRKLGRNATEYVLRTGKPLLADLSNPESAAQLRQMHLRGELEIFPDDTSCWLGVPLICADRTLGVLTVQSYAGGAKYTARDQELLTFISYQIANGLERARAAQSLQTAYAELELRVADRTVELREQIAVREKIEQQLKHEVLHDALTGLPNRTYLRDHLTRVISRQHRDPNYQFAVLFLDLDRFKVINDSAGHLVGDALLKEVAQRFSACVRGDDVVARLGGDEFAIVMEGIRGSGDTIRLARRIVSALAEPVRINDKELFTATSIGIAIGGPDYQQPEQLLRDADIALYRAKANPRQRYELFDEQLNREALHLLDLENELRVALARREFEPYFQPIVRLEDSSVVGYEALLRWHHPIRGVLAPGAFLAVAEASGILEAIDWQMFELTVAAIPQLLTQSQYVNLNVSPQHFRSAHLDIKLLALLRNNAVEPSQVHIEITEGALMDDPEQAIAIIERLRQAGVVTALDDFGTGYSSLSYLHRFALATVKIDRSFIIDLAPGVRGSGEPVVRAILALAQSVGLDVVAEGIETSAQHEALSGLGCLLGQGYLFARPQPLSVILATKKPAES